MMMDGKIVQEVGFDCWVARTFRDVDLERRISDVF